MPELDQRVPELVGGVDIRSLPLTALDGFVLSRIDGRTRVGEIVSMTGLPPEQVLQILERLIELGAARMQGSPTPERPPVSSSQSGIRGGAPQAPESGTYGAQSSPPGGGDPRRQSSARYQPVDLSSVRPRSPSSSPPLASSTPPRRRPSMLGNTPRKVFAESSISGPPPDMRSVPPRARTSTPARPATPIPPSQPAEPSNTRPPSTPSGSIPVTLPPLSLPPSMSGPPLFSTPPVGAAPTGRLDSDKPRFDSGANTGVLGATAASTSSLGPAAERSEPAALYDEKELDEEVELPRERRKQVLDLYYRLSTIDYYTLLGVKQSAEKKEIRSAYFSLSKAFHPDSMFRKELGSFKAKMTAVFQALTEAYEALGKKKTRDEYDAYLRSTRSVQEAERTLATDVVAQADANVEVPRPPPLPSTDYELPPPTPMPGPPREVSAEAKRIARELIERRLRGLPARPPEGKSAAKAPSEPEGAKPGANMPPRPSTPIDRQELVRQLGRTLMDVSKVTGSGDKLARAMTGAKAAFERGDIAASVQHMARAFSLAPERVDLHQEYERLSRMLATKLAQDYEEQAKFEMKQSKFAAAAVSWAKVVEGKPEDAIAHRHAAFCLLKAGGDLRGAQKYAQQSVFLAPNDIDSRVLLAQTYLTVGLRLNAKRELDAAAKLDPENEVVKNLLSDLAK